MGDQCPVCETCPTPAPCLTITSATCMSNLYHALVLPYQIQVHIETLSVCSFMLWFMLNGKTFVDDAIVECY